MGFGRHLFLVGFGVWAVYVSWWVWGWFGWVWDLVVPLVDSGRSGLCGRLPVLEDLCGVDVI